MPRTLPWPIGWMKLGKPEMSPPRVRNSPRPRMKIIIASETRMGWAPT